MNQLQRNLFATLAATTASLLPLNGDDSTARNDADLPLYVLDDYVVVAHTYAVPYVEVGSTVDLITREELELGQSAFVLDALRELPGITVRNNGGPGSVFGITTRGLNSNRPTVLIDGIEVSNPSSGEIINAGFLFSNSVERIEFLKGPQSSLYGADALAGVISIETRSPTEDGQSGSISAGYGSNDTFEGSIDYSLQDGAFDLTLGVNYHSSDGYSAQTSNTEDDSYENINVSAKVGYEITETIRLYALAYTINAETDFDGFSDPNGTSEEEQIFAKAGANLDISEDWQSQISFEYTQTTLTSEDTFGVFSSEGERYKTDWR
ncbi:MAG: TonB-dependent receptor plug domain-containing protein, partial [Verrucomicrobiota bacterium]